jgi:hypothetical protein
MCLVCSQVTPGDPTPECNSNHGVLAKAKGFIEPPLVPPAPTGSPRWGALREPLLVPLLVPRVSPG